VTSVASSRLLVVLHYGMYGGPHNRFANIHAPLAQEGIDLVVVLPDEDGDAAERFAAAGVPTVRTKLGRVRARRDPRLQVALARDFVADVRRLQRLIAVERADAVVLAGLANPHAAIAADRLGVPVIWQIVDSRVPSPAREVLMRSVRKRADCTMFWGERLRRMHKGERLRMPTTLSNSPVDFERFRQSDSAGRASRDAWGVPRDVPLVGSVANLNPQKGIEYLIRAVPLILRDAPDAHFVVVGKKYPTHRDYAEQLDRELALHRIPPDRFRFVGSRVDVENVLAAFDVKVISSVPASEGIPTTALEAMSVGVPVVTTDVGSAGEAVLDGETGYVVPPLSERDLAAKIGALLSDEDLRRRLGAAGRERVVARFGIERSIGDHLEALRLARAFRAGRSVRRGTSAAVN
jgi:glycosyltransferase involved in cell wall biosynthesis